MARAPKIPLGVISPRKALVVPFYDPRVPDVRQKPRKHREKSSRVKHRAPVVISHAQMCIAKFTICDVLFYAHDDTCAMQQRSSQSGRRRHFFPWVSRLSYFQYHIHLDGIPEYIG